MHYIYFYFEVFFVSLLHELCTEPVTSRYQLVLTITILYARLAVWKISFYVLVIHVLMHSMSSSFFSYLRIIKLQSFSFQILCEFFLNLKLFETEKQENFIRIMSCIEFTTITYLLPRACSIDVVRGCSLILCVS